MRITPAEIIELIRRSSLTITFSDKAGQPKHKIDDVVSPDALLLVRCGLRSAHDPRILDTVKVIDGALSSEMSTGKGWVRSSFDGYGEKEDGTPYDQTGVGRCWPMLAAERGQYAIAAGDRLFAREMLATIARQAGECGMLPEQVWNAPDISERELYNGRATGSSMPLVWAHAEYIRLLRSLHEGKVWDEPPQTAKRYIREQQSSNLQIWTERIQRKWMLQSRVLRLDFDKRCEVWWRIGDTTWNVVATGEPKMQRHCVYLLTQEVPAGSVLLIQLHREDRAAEKVEIQVLATHP